MWSGPSCWPSGTLHRAWCTADPAGLGYSVCRDEELGAQRWCQRRRSLEQLCAMQGPRELGYMAQKSTMLQEADLLECSEEAGVLEPWIRQEVCPIVGAATLCRAQNWILEPVRRLRGMKSYNPCPDDSSRLGRWPQ